MRCAFAARRAAVFAVAACSYWACSVDGLDVRGMPCPCPASLVCDPESNSCTDRAATTSSEGGAGGAGAASSAAQAGGRAAGGTGAGGGGAAGSGATSGGAPACKAAIVPCASAEECCGDLECKKTTAGVVCCGMDGEVCKTYGGEDCCGELECFDETGAFCDGGSCHCMLP